MADRSRRPAAAGEAGDTGHAKRAAKPAANGAAPITSKQAGKKAGKKGTAGKAARKAAKNGVAPEMAFGRGPGNGAWPRSNVLIEHHGWHRMVRTAERLVARAAAAAGVTGNVLLSSDRAVKRLNARHRRRNKPTNVLTFEPLQGFAGGDIVLALETVRREAAAAKRRPAHHLAHLVVHGALHLRGYDHHDAGDARRMEMEEARILHRIGVPNPWKRT